MPGYLSEDSPSPYYSVEYSGSVGILNLYSYSGVDWRGSLTCYSQEAGISDPASVTLHIIDGDDQHKIPVFEIFIYTGVCTCGNSTETPFPLSLCPDSSDDLPCSVRHMLS